MIADASGTQNLSAPALRKARRIIGNQLTLRNADTGDAAFIVRLRTDPRKRRYISATSPDLAQQIAWLEHYAHAQDQAYFIAEDMSGKSVGTIRIYDPVGDSFCFGSWIMADDVPAAYAVESVLIVYRYALDVLEFNKSYFAVRKTNRSVWNFMERFGAERTGETEVDYLYETERAPVLESFRRYAHLLPNPIRVIDDPVS